MRWCDIREHTWRKENHITTIVTDGFSMRFFDLYYRMRGYERQV